LVILFKSSIILKYEKNQKRIKDISCIFIFLFKINIDKISAQKVKIIAEITPVLNTHIKGNKIIDVETEPIKDPIVEKNKSFHIFSQELFHFNNSDNKGIV